MPTSKTIEPKATGSNVTTLSLTDPDLVLTTGTPDAGKYGNKYDGATDADGSISAVFASTGVDLELTFDAFDVDQDNEIQVFLNGTLLGSVAKGINDGVTGQKFLIPAADQDPGNNLLTFEQTINTTWKWGVTNIMVATPGTTIADMALDIGVRDTASYGNRFDGQSDSDGVITATFTGGVEELELTFDAYDVDSNGEVEVFLNGVSIAQIAKGINNGFSEQVITIPLADQLAGTNTLTFEQTVNDGYKWGVKNVMVATPGAGDAPIALTLGQTETGKYGNKYDGATDLDGEVAMSFDSIGKPMLLEFDAFDIDSTGEVEVYVNGTLVGPVSVGLNNALSAKTFLVGTDVQVPGTNEITFVQASNVSFKWGVTNVVIDEAPADIAEMILERGVMDTGSYGNKFNGTNDTDGEVKALFQGGSEDLLLTFEAFDLDHKGEVEVFLNGESFAKLKKGKNNALEAQSFIIKVEDQENGLNELTFEQTRDNTYKWGVTNVEIDSVLDTFSPNDDRYVEQWGLKAAGDLERIWTEYTGNGVSVAVYDDGMDTSHSELDGNYDASKHVTVSGEVQDAANGDGSHGTAVAGIIAAENDGSGIVGVAFDAGITGVNIIDGPASASAANLNPFGNAMNQMDTFDVVNHSWGVDPGFDENDAAENGLFDKATSAYENAAENGRGGLGTVIVKSAGNATANSNGDQMDGSRYSITVAATTEENEVASYSNHGANVFISGPSAGGLLQASSGILTTDVTGEGGFQAGKYTGTTNLDGFGGTSAAAPFVSGVAALMLDANESLGWRDVQSILAYSATHTGKFFGPQPSTPFFDFENDKWQHNGADNWNGGGLHFSEDYGYGQVDAYSAVRMAEVWSLFGDAQTSANEATHQIADASGVKINSGATKEISLDTTGLDLVVENVQVSLALNDNTVNVFLVSDAGTKVALYRSGEAAEGAMTWSFGAEGFRGETLGGAWELQVVNKDGARVTLSEYTVDWYGSDPTLAGAGDDVYHYTDEMFERLERETKDGDLMAMVEDASRTTLEDTDGGVDWLNFAAMTGDITLDLSDGGAAASAGRTFISLVNGSEIENAVGGDGRDTLVGNAGANELVGMRGNDTISGGGSGDDISGGDGDDILDGEGGSDVLNGDKGKDTINGGSGSDTINGGNGADILNGEDGGDTIRGGEGSDIILGGNGNDQLEGEAGGDSLFGGAGDDTLLGGAGSDYLDGGSDNDTLDGGTGSDTLIGGSGDDVMEGGDGNDTAIYNGGGATIDLNVSSAQAVGSGFGSDSFSGIENLIGGFGADNFTGDSQNNVLKGNAGNDTLSGGDGEDTLEGGDNNDTLNGGQKSDTLSGGNGNDALSGGNGDDDLDGDGGDDDLRGGNGNDLLDGDSGNDTLRGGGGDDDLDGGSGNDTAVYDGAAAVVDLNIGTAQAVGVGYGSDTLSSIENLTGGDGDDVFIGDGSINVLIGAGGNDVLTGNGGNDDMFGGNGDDTLNGDSGYDDLYGGEGADTLIGGSGNDDMFGGAGNDTLTGGSGVDELEGDAGDDIMDGGTENDFLLGGLGNDTMSGGDDDDSLDGEEGDDVLNGDAGNDTLNGGLGLDTLNGGTGTDTLSGGGDADILNGGDGADALNGDAGDDVLNGDAGNDVLNGGDNNDTLNGGADADILNGGSGDDTLNGDAGADTLVGGEGNDVLSGGDGIDTVVYDGAAASVDLSVLSAQAIGVNYGADTLSGIENVTGGGAADTLTGDSVANVLNGAGGNDVLNGDGGADQLEGGSGNDILDGGTGDDVLNGGDNADTLNGEDGNDTLTGGNGADVFEFALGSDGDRITDFTLSGADEDDISLFFGATLTFGDLSISDDGLGNALIDMGGGDTLTLESVDHTLLSSDHFNFFDV
ncbi:MAG: S8 family serine peptidase [Arenibacterium sp.]